MSTYNCVCSILLELLSDSSFLYEVLLPSFYLFRMSIIMLSCGSANSWLSFQLRYFITALSSRCRLLPIHSWYKYVGQSPRVLYLAIELVQSLKAQHLSSLWNFDRAKTLHWYVCLACCFSRPLSTSRRQTFTERIWKNGARHFNLTMTLNDADIGLL